VNNAISSLAIQRGNLGASEARLSVAIKNLSVSRENFAAAESRIRDVDVAEESAELTRLNILQQAGAAVLAQANQQPQLALQLLG
jgi:flagellin